VPGAVIREDEIERSLLLLSDLPGISVRSVLRAGAQPGTADLVVRVSESPLAQARFGFDNQGNSYTGRNRLTVELSANDWLGLGEAWSAKGITSFEGLTAQTLGVSAPHRRLRPARGPGLHQPALQDRPRLRAAGCQRRGPKPQRLCRLSLHARQAVQPHGAADAGAENPTSTASTRPGWTSRSRLTLARLDIYGDWRDGLDRQPGADELFPGLTRGNLSRDTLPTPAFDAASARRPATSTS
jgi:hypothetical protein